MDGRWFGVAAGLAASRFLKASPSVPMERQAHRQLGELSDSVIGAAKETASDALESGKQIAHEAADAAKEHGQDLASNLQERTKGDSGQLTGQVGRSGSCPWGLTAGTQRTAALFQVRSASGRGKQCAWLAPGIECVSDVAADAELLDDPVGAVLLEHLFHVGDHVLWNDEKPVAC